MAEDVEKDWFDSPKDSSDEENEKDLWNIEENGKGNKNAKSDAEGEECQEDEEDNDLDFSSEEMEVLVREVEKRHEALFGDYKEGESPKCRWLIWQEVAEQVNVVSSTYRNLEQVRVKWFEYKNPSENVRRAVRKGRKRKTKLHTGMFMKKNKETFQVRSMSCLMRRRFNENSPPRRIPVSSSAGNDSNPEAASLEPEPDPISRNAQDGVPKRQYHSTTVSNSVKKEKEVIVENIPVTNLEPIILKDGNTIMKVLPLSKKRILEVKKKDKEKEALETRKAEESVDRWIDNMEKELRLQKLKKLEVVGQPSQKENKSHHAESEEEGTKKKEVVRTLADLEKLLMEGVKNSMNIGVADIKTCQKSSEVRLENASCASVVPSDGDNVLSEEVMPSTSTASVENPENDASSTSPIKNVANNLVSSVDKSPQSLTPISSAEASSSTPAVQKIEQGSSILTGSDGHEKNSTNNEDSNVKVQWEQLKIKHPVTGKTVIVTKVYPKGTKIIEDIDKKQFVLPRRDLLKDSAVPFKQLIDTKQVSKASSIDDAQKTVIEEPLTVLSNKESKIVDTLSAQKNKSQVSSKVSPEKIVIKDLTTGKDVCLKKIVPLKRDLVGETGIALPSGDILVKNPLTGKDIVMKKMILSKEALEERSSLRGDSLKKASSNTFSDGKKSNDGQTQESRNLVVENQETIMDQLPTVKQSATNISALSNTSSSTKSEIAESSTIRSETSGKMTENADHPPTIKTVVSNKGILRMTSTVPSKFNSPVKSSTSVAFSSSSSTLSTSSVSQSNKHKDESNAIPKKFAKVAPNIESVSSTPIVMKPVSLQPVNAKVPVTLLKCPPSAVPVNIAIQPSTMKSAVTVNLVNNSSGVKTLIPVDISNHPSAVKNAKPIKIILHPSSASTSPSVSDDKNTAVKNIVALQTSELGSFLEFKNSENISEDSTATGNANTDDSRAEELAGKQVVIAKLQLPPTESSSNDVVVKDPITGKNITIKKLTVAKDNTLVTALLKRAMQKGTLVGDCNLPLGKLKAKNVKVTEEQETLGANSVSKNNLPSMGIIKNDSPAKTSRNFLPVKQAVTLDEKPAVQHSVQNTNVMPSISFSKQNDLTFNRFLPATTGNDAQTKEILVMNEEMFSQNEINYDGSEQCRQEGPLKILDTIKEEPVEEYNLIPAREEKNMDTNMDVKVKSIKTYHLENVTDESLDKEVFMVHVDSTGKLIPKSISQNIDAVNYEITDQQPGIELVASRESHGKSEQGHLSTKDGSPMMSIPSHHPSKGTNYKEDCSRKFAGKQIVGAKRSCETPAGTPCDTKRLKTSMEWKEKEMSKNTKGMDMPSLDSGRNSVVEVAVEEVEMSSSLPSRTKSIKIGEEQSDSREKEQLHPLVRAALVGKPLDFEAELNKMDGLIKGKEVKKEVEEVDLCEEEEGRKAIIGDQSRERNSNSQEEEKCDVQTSKEQGTLSAIKITDSTVVSSSEQQQKGNCVSAIDSVSPVPARSRRKISPLENRSYQMFKQQKPKLETWKEKAKSSVRETEEIHLICLDDISPSETLSVQPSLKCYTRIMPRRGPLVKRKS